MKKFLIIFLIFFFSFKGYSLEWPVEFPVVISAFAESRGDHYNSGIDFQGNEEMVYAAADGEIVFYHEEDLSGGTLPSGPGSFIVIEHERQLRTSYSHLKKGSIVKDRTEVSAGDVIGIVGDTGASRGLHLHFEVIDMELKEIINPLLLLPPVPDNTDPVIKDLYLENQADNKLFLIESEDFVPRGLYRVIAEIYDYSGDVDYFCLLAPYSVTLRVNNEEAAAVSYNSIKIIENRTVLSGINKSVGDYYYDDIKPWLIGIGTIQLEKGIKEIVIKARDFAGNETVKIFTVTVE